MSDRRRVFAGTWMRGGFTTIQIVDLTKPSLPTLEIAATVRSEDHVAVHPTRLSEYVVATESAIMYGDRVLAPLSPDPSDDINQRQLIQMLHTPNYAIAVFKLGIIVWRVAKLDASPRFFRAPMGRIVAAAASDFFVAAIVRIEDGAPRLVIFDLAVEIEPKSYPIPPSTIHELQFDSNTTTGRGGTRILIGRSYAFDLVARRGWHVSVAYECIDSALADSELCVYGIYGYTTPIFPIGMNRQFAVKTFLNTAAIRKWTFTSPNTSDSHFETYETAIVNARFDIEGGKRMRTDASSRGQTPIQSSIDDLAEFMAMIGVDDVDVRAYDFRYRDANDIELYRKMYVTSEAAEPDVDAILPLPSLKRAGDEVGAEPLPSRRRSRSRCRDDDE